MTVESDDQLRGLRSAGQAVAATLADVSAAAVPGVTTADLDDIAREVFARFGARSAPHDVYGFPGCILVSVNDEAVHGIPRGRVLAPDDLVKIDVTAELDGYVADAAVTVAMPGASAAACRRAECATTALAHGIAAARRSAATRDIGRAVQREVHRRGFKVLRELSGHGVGASIHEPPSVPNWPAPWASDRLHDGLVITIEPIIAVGTQRCFTDRDGWTIKTSDGSLSAHAEHTLVIDGDQPILLTV